MPDAPLKALPEAVLEVRNLRIAFRAKPPVVRGLDLTIQPGKIACLVGESGSGKSATALALMRLLPKDATVTADQLGIDGHDILTATAPELARLRGDRVAIVFQDASMSLHPLMTIGDQIAEALSTHRPVDRSTARAKALTMLDSVHLPGGEERLDLYPHELSGGMRQRALIAMALICRPRLLIADEPTASLDSIVQRQIMRLIRDLCREAGTGVLLITHDLWLVRESADEIAVIYAGQIVERGHRSDVLDDPMHPYTLALLATHGDKTGTKVLRSAESTLAEGCTFYPRCPVAVEKCRENRPELAAISPSHFVACWRAPLEAVVT